MIWPLSTTWLKIEDSLLAPPRTRGAATRAGLSAAAEMPDEERLGGVVLEDRHLDVTPRVDVEGLVRRADGIEETETCVAGDQLVVPLKEEQDRDA
jgi:hypothetical protein